MRKAYSIILTLIILMGFQNMNAQEDPIAKLYLKNVKDTVKLRWLVTDLKVWETCIKQGYDIYRNEIGTDNFVKLNDTLIRALNPEEWAIRNTIFIDDTIPEMNPEADTMSMFALSYQYPKETDLEFDMPDASNGVDFGDDSRAVMHMLHSVATVYSKEAAYISGYTFADSTFKENTSYQYYICKGGEEPENAIASESINTGDTYPDLTPQINDDRTNKKVSFLFWRKPDTLNAVVGAYEVYRSEKKNSAYELLTTPPQLALLNPYVFEDKPAVYKDTTLEKNKVYYYKIRAIDLFGDYSDFSEPYSVTEKELLSTVPRIIKAETSKDFKNTIEWEIKEHDKNNISALFVYRNTKTYNDFAPISKQLSPDTRTFTDKKTVNSNYYKIMAIGKGNDTVWSALKFVNIPDSIPPSTPVITSAICDSLGIVTLKWKHGGEPDLERFNIYTANYEHEEFSRIANIGVDTIFRDTISLGVMNKSVFYKIVAYDKVFNPSDFSAAYEVLRYDTIPPNPPLITNIESLDGSVKLKWACSSSPDVKHSSLMRKLKADSAWKTIRRFGITGNKYETYDDTTVIKGIKYQYTLIATDEFGLKSSGGRVVGIQAYDNGMREPIKNFNAELNKRKHTVKLTWEYPYFGVERFYIYRTVNDGPKSILTSTKANVFEYYDEETGRGNKYTYCLKAVYQNGAESPVTEELIIKY